MQRHDLIAEMLQPFADVLADFEREEAAAWDALDAPTFLRLADRTLLDRLDAATLDRQRAEADLAHARHDTPRWVAAQGEA